jgi:hypothetical protein
MGARPLATSHNQSRQATLGTSWPKPTASNIKKSVRKSETGDSKAGSDGSDLSGQADDLTDLCLAPAFPPMRAGNHSLILTHRE